MEQSDLQTLLNVKSRVAIGKSRSRKKSAEAEDKTRKRPESKKAKEERKGVKTKRSRDDGDCPQATVAKRQTRESAVKQTAGERVLESFGEYLKQSKKDAPPTWLQTSEQYVTGIKGLWLRGTHFQADPVGLDTIASDDFCQQLKRAKVNRKISSPVGLFVKFRQACPDVWQVYLAAE